MNSFYFDSNYFFFDNNEDLIDLIFIVVVFDVYRNCVHNLEATLFRATKYFGETLTKCVKLINFVKGKQENDEKATKQKKKEEKEESKLNVFNKYIKNLDEFSSNIIQQIFKNAFILQIINME